MRNAERAVKKYKTIPLMLGLGIALGIFSKQLDLVSVNDAVWWQYILGVLDLRNVFSSLEIWLLLALAIAVYSKTAKRASFHVFLFFTGMCISYHLWTIFFAGFNPGLYMLIWYGLTLVSPLLAYICWYGKGETKAALLIDSLVLGVMAANCFSVGMWYFDFRGVIKTLIFLASVLVLYQTPRRTAISLAGGMILAFVFRLIV